MQTDINHPANPLNKQPDPAERRTLSGEGFFKSSWQNGETKREKWAAQFMAAHLSAFNSFPPVHVLDEYARESVKAAEALEKALNERQNESK
ncbi:hypothetical protein DCC81_12055 [Chitinophaga parva]|uniref:Uncharacterized protein n=1 Tax=Chitinophaga parva TaxID=2169414 RepID=A0A2T7BFI1_9BACT|nr:hypothetical protein [Chitinophaga parva]PUZ25040.1 hypothetical protein DCC81_12055 [Chitinophaga parva]